MAKLLRHITNIKKSTETKKSTAVNKRALNRHEKSATRLNTSSRIVKIKPSIRKKWQKPTVGTVNYVMDIIDLNIENTLSTVDAQLCEEVHNILTRLKSRLKHSISKLKVPQSKVKSYYEVDQLVIHTKTKMKSIIHKTERVDKQIEQNKRLLEELEQEKEELEKRLDGTEGINVKEMECEINLDDDRVINAFQATINSMVKDSIPADE